MIAHDLNTTTAQRVAADLRRRILLGELRPGQRMKLEELATLCGVSHMPVREALRELESEGVLEVFAHRGAVIKGVDVEFVHNLYDVRGAIEGMLTARCAERLDDAGAQRLRQLAEAHEAAVAAGDKAAILLANGRLHEAINAQARNPEAVRMLARGRVLVDALRLRYGFGSGRAEAIVAEHRELLAAIVARDAERAGLLARRHCDGARDDLIAKMQAVAAAG